MNSETTHPSAFVSETRWAEAIAAQLRLVLSTTADDTVENRRTYIEEEIRHGLETVPTAQRDQCLAELSDKFPTWEGNTAPVASAAPDLPGTIDEIMSALERAASSLTPEKKSAVIARLVKLGLTEQAPV